MPQEEHRCTSSRRGVVDVSLNLDCLLRLETVNTFDRCAEGDIL